METRENKVRRIESYIYWKRVYRGYPKLLKKYLREIRVSHIISSTENYFGRKSSDKIIMLSKISLICKDS